MGQALSKHELFVQSLSKSLKTRGIKVKTKELLQYFDYIHHVCPWFPLEGTIDILRWKRVGDALNDYYRVFGPQKVPVTAFSYWNLIAEILNPKTQDPLVAEICLHGEQALKVSARNTPVPQPPCPPMFSFKWRTPLSPQILMRKQLLSLILGRLTALLSPLFIRGPLPFILILPHIGR